MIWATLARAAAWRRENPDGAAGAGGSRPAEFFHRLRLDPPARPGRRRAWRKEELMPLSLSPDYRLECDM